MMRPPPRSPLFPYTALSPSRRNRRTTQRPLPRRATQRPNPRPRRNPWRLETMRMPEVRTKLSMEEFLQLPDEPGKQELLGGRLIDLPPAKYKYCNARHDDVR